MTNNNFITGTVMLETMWETRRMDLLDLISPFVFYAAAKVCAPQETVDLEQTLMVIKKDFGYVDMPLTVIERVLKRNPELFKKKQGHYYLNRKLDDAVSKIEKRRDDCEKKIQVIGEQLAEYLEAHKKVYKSISPEKAIRYLQGFFVRQGLFLGIDQLEEHEPKLKNLETDYYIAQYLYEKRDAHAIEFEYVIDLVKGYFLQSAIYLQAENGNVVTSTYRDVNFYYDTPFLLRLLGFKTIEDENSANELHISLARQKGNFYYFPQTQSEIEGILSRYQKGYKRSNQYTLEGLDEKKYTPSSVERLKKTWESKLQYSYNTELAQRPEYPLKYDGTIDERCVIDESELAEFLRNNIFWRTDEAMDADLESVIGIHKLRKNIQSGEIEHCKAIFVTTNTALANAVNKYYRENINDKAFPLVITDTDLAALTWIKCGSVGDLPERQLLRNAYMAMQPAPEMLEKFSNILDQMQSEGKITSEIAIVLRSSSFVKKEVMFASFAGEEGINEDLVNEIEKKLREESSKDAREDERRKAERQRQQEQHERIAKAYRQARMKALDIKNSKLACWKKIAVGVSVILFLFTTVGLIVSIVSVKPNNLFVAGALFVFAIISLFGIIDFYKQKERFIYKWLVSQANKQYEKAYEELCKEYLEIAEGEEIVLQNEDDCAR